MKTTRLTIILSLLMLSTGMRHEALGNADIPAIVFLSDFGFADDSVSQCKGVIESVFPGARVTDMTHEVPPYDIRLASFYLADSALAWPAGTVFLAVVDPGVGTSRKSAALKTKTGHFFVGPDNGIFTLAMRRLGTDRIISIENPAYMRKTVTSTFHGRDVYSPAAAWLARDPSVLEKFGPRLTKPVLLDWPVPAPGTGTIMGTLLRVEPPYGNVWTDIAEAVFRGMGINEGDTLEILLEGRVLTLPFVKTFGDVRKGEPLAYINSRGLLSLALNMGNFSQKFGLRAGLAVTVTLSASGEK